MLESASGGNTLRPSGSPVTVDTLTRNDRLASIAREQHPRILATYGGEYSNPNVERMVARIVDAVQYDLETARKSAREEGRSELSALIQVACEKEPHSQKFMMGLLAAAAEHPELLDPVRGLMTQLREDLVSQSVDPDLARIVMLAVDGLHFADLLGMDFLSPEERARVEARLVDMVSEKTS